MNRLLLVLSFLAGAGIFGFLLRREGPMVVLETVQGFGIWPLIGFVVFSMVNLGLYAWRWQLITNAHLPDNKHISFPKMYAHRMAGFAASYLTPAAQVGGEPVRIAMLVSDKVPAKAATSAVTFDILVEMIAYMSFIVIGVLLALVSGIGSGPAIWGTGIILTILVVIAIWFIIQIANGKDMVGPLLKRLHADKTKRVGPWLKQTQSLMHAFAKGHPHLLLIALALAVLVVSIRVVEVIYIAHFFGVSLTFAQSFLIATLPGIALLLPVPAGVGVFEGGFATVFTLLAVPLAAIPFALIIRLRDLVFITLGSVHMIQQGGTWLARKK